MIAAAFGANSRARAANGGFIVLSQYDGDTVATSTFRRANMIAYKGFNADFTCRRFQYAVGETYTHCGPVRVCFSGFHACPNPLDVLAYYPPATSRYALVECSGRIDTGEDGKIACDTITIVRELTIAELIRASDAHAATTGDYAHAATTGDYAHTVTTGHRAHAVTTGDYARAVTTGDSAVSVAVGRMSAAKAAPGGFLVLAQYRGSQIVAVKTAQVGKRGIKPDTWYCLDSNGKFVETEVC